MSPTSGSAATTRSAPSAASAERVRRRRPRVARLTVREAMGVTPEECGPLEGEALVVALVAAVDLVELEAQALELGGVPGREGRVRELPVDRAEGLLGVVEARAERGRDAAQGP